MRLLRSVDTMLEKAADKLQLISEINSVASYGVGGSDAGLTTTAVHIFNTSAAALHVLDKTAASSRYSEDLQRRLTTVRHIV